MSIKSWDMDVWKLILVVFRLAMAFKLAKSLNYRENMTNHEFMSTRSSKISRYLMLHGPRRMTGFRLDKVDSIPHSIDWRKKGAVTGIRDSSCCAFSTVVAVEGINKMKTGELVTLSEQKLVDCAFELIKQSDGLTTENNYPYEAKDESCDSSRLNEKALMKAVANQPVSIVIDAGGKDFQFYSELNHGVAVVGYGETHDGTKYSWDIDAKQGLCGLTLEASYPVKLHSNNVRKASKRAKDEF
ncbi:hypothetical protein ES332_D01G199400v1 [Gossypium tomentosum]|uniref:Peptidase C1A papain C-terminal domain-containing protein n=1 Tax=Gossypium tomentosum TaxID=34277 RepID=A0A5D2MBE5_GOSTO|nr:hypothetical protein ES332_D01G199400v1 [Gossypium tomentosum]